MIVQPTIVDLPQAETLPFSDVEVIGTVAGKQYARTKDGRELLIGSLLQAKMTDRSLPRPPRRRLRLRCPVTR